MIELIRGDITTVKVDAIVNAANSGMLGGGGVDGAIHRAAGPELVEACRQVKKVDGIRCPVGEARITPGFKLPAKWVIHTVGPRYHYDEDPEAKLRSAYRSSLKLALENDIKSIAFPAISCGVFAYPVEEAAEIALTECFKDDYESLYISFCLFQDETLRIFQAVLNSLTQK